MLAIALELLTGRYGATEYNDRNRAEWPPHPARLFSALVAAWADDEQPDSAERAALLWLESQEPPQIACSDTGELARRHIVTVYVPGNDPTALSTSVDDRDRIRVAAAEDLMRAEEQGGRKEVARATKNLHGAQLAYREALRKAATATGTESSSMTETAMEVLPELRNRQPRTFPTLTPQSSTVWFVWPDVDPNGATRRALDSLLARVGRLGHSATLVSCRLVDGCEQPAAFVPRSDGTTVLRVPSTGLLDQLERDFVRHQGTRERLLPAEMAAYGPPPVRHSIEPSGLHSGDWIVLDLPPANAHHQLAVHLTRSLELARAVRDALVEHEPTTTSGLLSGQFPDGKPRPHVAFVPLPDVGHRWADGTLRGVAVVLPRGVDRTPVEAALAAWQKSGFSVRIRDREVIFDAARVAPAARGWSEVPMPLRRSTWCRPSRHWITTTPIALDRFVPALNHPAKHETADEQVRAIIARSCARTGLPEPTDVVISPVGMTSAVPPAGRHRSNSRRSAREFPPFVAAGSGQVRQTVHAALTFAEKVRGPVLLGAGRYLGYGLLLPSHDRELSNGPFAGH